MNRLLKLTALLCLGNFIPSAYAQPPLYTVIAPACLTKNITDDNNVLASSKKLKLLQVDRKHLDELIDAKHQQTSACGGFLNVTDEWLKRGNTTSPNAFLRKIIKPPVIIPVHKISSYQINSTKQVNQLINQLSPENMWANLTTLTNFHDRFSNSDNGVAAANWLKAQIDTMVKSSGRDDVSMRFVATENGYKQNSLVVKIGNSNIPGVVVSAHMDTLAGLMPGADDDGSGTVSVLEIARLLLNSNFHFKRPIYLIWYAAEEEGLLGSESTVNDFIQQKIPVVAVLHFDMIGFSYQNDPTLWLVQDNTDPELTEFLAVLTKTYVKQPVKLTSCGYACSDHASWNSKGYKVGFAYEGEMGRGILKDNPYLHTSADTMEKLSLRHMADYAKLGTAFAVEMAYPAEVIKL
jgi:bacterial leucyl aminopeptidase